MIFNEKDSNLVEISRKINLELKDPLNNLMILNIDTMNKMGLFFSPNPVFNFHMILDNYSLSRHNNQSKGKSI